MSIAGVESDDELGSWIDAHMEPDAFVDEVRRDEEEEVLVVRIGTHGWYLNFQTSLNAFWRDVNELEDDVIAEHEADSDC